MFNYMLLGYAVLHLTILAWTFSWADNKDAKIWILRGMLFGMFYDNLLQGLGVWFINASWYESASILRFVLHVTVLPFLTVFTLKILQLGHVEIASKPLFISFCWAFTSAALTYGIYQEVYLLELGPKSALGVEKLSNLSKIPPIATILTNILVMIMAAVLLRVNGWKWLFLGALFIFIVNGATATLTWGFIAGNFAEVVFILCLLATTRKFQPIQTS
ncbi:hypothetical protein RGQ13_18825 [Thalassotalea psychrophila]|uniref:Uncharacterized protein n=1 Tax=Thalassotalea psychrophila TaxID=3065647 RepID=A0ABY9TTI9_9GAMM|nr:hypothetical protein RGQ13_18825 [Colwelliaceae bacterium SQ149]